MELMQSLIKEVRMKSSSFRISLGFLMFVCFQTASLSAGEQQQYQGCVVTTDGKGSLTSMDFTNLTTYLNIEKEFLFTLNSNGTPAKCTITFNNGIQRDMKQGEMDLHFAQCGGPNIVWDYYKEHGRVVSYSLDKDQIPFSAYGKVSRLILRNGSEYIGRIGKMADKPDGISLTIEGAGGGPLSFFNNTVASIEQMKDAVRS
jgi:hypothetical protein